MRDEDKTKEQLIYELNEFRKHHKQPQKIDCLAEQKRHGEALRLSEELFHKIFHYSPNSLTMYSLDSRKFTDANVCCLKMHGYTRDEFIEHTARELNLWVALSNKVSHCESVKLSPALEASSYLRC